MTTLRTLIASAIATQLQRCPCCFQINLFYDTVRLATGDLGNAASVLPKISRAVFSQSYANAFQNLLYILIAITILAALAVFWFLGRKPVEPTDPASALCDVELTLL